MSTAALEGSAAVVAASAEAVVLGEVAASVAVVVSVVVGALVVEAVRALQLYVSSLR